MISVLMLTQDEEVNIRAALDSLLPSETPDRAESCERLDVHVLDSGSTDRTVDMARAWGATVHHHPMDDWSSQLNRALDTIAFRHEFVFQMDADERATPQLLEQMRAAVKRPGNAVAFSLPRHDFFQNRRLRHVQATPRYIRLYKPEHVRFARLVNPVTQVNGPVEHLGAPLLHYPFSKGLGQWLERHGSYAELEAREILRMESTSQAESWAGLLRKAFTAPILQQRRESQKAIFQRLPARPLLRFAWQYGLKGGFLDGRAGLTYALLQCFYECMILFRTWELRNKTARPKEPRT